MPPNEDNRPAAVVMKQWRELTYLRSQLVKQGLCGADATPRQVIDAVRAAIPADLMAELPSKT